MCRHPMPITSIVILAASLVLLLIPLVALEVLSDMFPHVQDYKRWLSVLLWAAVIAVVYLVVAPSLGLSRGE
jgi:hypothetical protein